MDPSLSFLPLDETATAQPEGEQPMTGRRLSIHTLPRQSDRLRLVSGWVNRHIELRMTHPMGDTDVDGIFEGLRVTPPCIHFRLLILFRIMGVLEPSQLILGHEAKDWSPVHHRAHTDIKTRN